MLSKLLKKILKADDNNHKTPKGYLVRSLYFDNLDNDIFEDKMAGMEKRSKYRLRIYNTDTKLVKFEIKHKFNEVIEKQSVNISKEDAIEIQNSNYDVMLKYKNPILNKAYIEFKKNFFSPVTLVDYVREAFIYDANKIRITFDRFLKSSQFQLDMFKSDIILKSPLKKDIVIMEIKYDKFIPQHIKEILQIPSFERSAISKYCIGRLDEFESIF